ncbi:MAG: MFS transporter [Bradyrhizobiaceae bacterium]|nr:MAG: MFS transporter [Bradyrhizobiaceae bacterium]
MDIESQTSTSAQLRGRRFARRVGLFYASIVGVGGIYLPFFPVWLRAIGIDPYWIGLITAAPAISRFTVLPPITAAAERRQMLRGAIIAMAFLSAFGFVLLGLLHQPLAILIVFALIACVWTPLTPMTDGYTLKGLQRHRLDYGPLRLWGSAAFIATALGCGWLADFIAARHLIWIVVAAAFVSALIALRLEPLERPDMRARSLMRANALLRQPLFIAIMATAALVQGSHAAYYSFASISWQAAGLRGLTIAMLWSIGVIAEIAVFALSPRFTLSPALIVAIGASGAALRWFITAQEPPVAVLAVVQLMHGLSFGMTHIGTVLLLARSVPHHVLASAQGYLTAAIGFTSSVMMIVSGLIYARAGLHVYYAMSAMGLMGLIVIASVRARLDRARTITA